MGALRPSDGERFRLWMVGEHLALNTIRRRLGIARPFFRIAVDDGLIARNPMAGQKVSVVRVRERFYFVTREDAEKVLLACPDHAWRTIFSLCRWGGLRCPSEVLTLRWEDIDWDADRILVRCIKPSHPEGRDVRFVPLFPEVWTALLESFTLWLEADENRSPYVVTRYRDLSQNLRTTFHKIIERAGLKAWPKLFANLRSRRATELIETFPNHVVNAWLGHTEDVADMHYRQVTPEHWARATSASSGDTDPAKTSRVRAGDEAAQRAAHSTGEPGGTEGHEESGTRVFGTDTAEYHAIPLEVIESSARGGSRTPTPFGTGT